MTDDDRERRRLARANWAVRFVPLVDDRDAHEPPLTIEERLAATWELTRQAWAVSGLPWPDYDRAHMPVRLARLGDEDRG